MMVVVHRTIHIIIIIDECVCVCVRRICIHIRVLFSMVFSFLFSLLDLVRSFRCVYACFMYEQKRCVFHQRRHFYIYKISHSFQDNDPFDIFFCRLVTVNRIEPTKHTHTDNRITDQNENFFLFECFRYLYTPACVVYVCGRQAETHINSCKIQRA